jgi:coatomer protein complex subunit alpha (xenin)
VEFAYQRTKNFERLSFLYLITGNVEKLSKMLKIASLRDDMMGRFHNSLFLGDVVERVHVLKDAGQQRLAWLTAKLHGLTEETAKLETLLGDRLPKNLPPELANPDAAGDNAPALLFPPLPILKQSNWPLLEVRKSFPDGDMPDDKEEEKGPAAAESGEGKVCRAPMHSPAFLCLR